MRTLIYLFIAVLFYSCYKESEIKEDPIIVTERPLTIFNGNVIIDAEMSTESTTLIHGGENYEIHDDQSKIYLESIKKYGDILMLHNGNHPISITQVFLLENQTSLVKMVELPELKTLIPQPNDSDLIETATSTINIIESESSKSKGGKTNRTRIKTAHR